MWWQNHISISVRKIMDGDFFEAWFKDMFLNEIEPNKAIIMDNASFHRKNMLYKLCK